MTLGEMRNLTKGCPSGMIIMMPVGIDTDLAITVCKENSSIQKVMFQGKMQKVLFLYPCLCDVMEDSVDIAESVSPDQSN